jgi:MFS family permease
MTPPKSPNLLSRTFTSFLLYRNFRFLWLGSWTEHLAEWMELTALLWLMNEMTHSPFMGTLLVTLRFLPMVVFAFIGGIVVDRFDRRTVLRYALLALAVLSIALALGIRAGFIQPWHLLVYAALDGIITSFNHPARSTMIPNLVKREHLLNALTLDNASVMASRVIGGPLAGFIISIAGTTPVIGLRAVGALVAIFWLSKVQSPPNPVEAKRGSVLQNFTEGMRYVGKNKPVLTQVLLYILPFFLMNSYTGLLPYFATNTLHIGADLYGVLNAAPGLGAVAATFGLASFVHFSRKRLLLIIAGIVQGAGLIIFAFVPFYALSLLLLIIIGGFSTVFMSLNNTLIQEMITDQVRGRVLSLREVTFGLGPAGSLISGALAVSVGVSFALGVAGGISLVVLLGILIGIPQMRQRTK